MKKVSNKKPPESKLKRGGFIISGNATPRIAPEITKEASILKTVRQFATPIATGNNPPAIIARAEVSPVLPVI